MNSLAAVVKTYLCRFFYASMLIMIEDLPHPLSPGENFYVYKKIKTYNITIFYSKDMMMVNTKEKH